MFLSEVSVNRPVFTTMIVSALVVFGIICYTMIGVDLMPNVEFPYVTVMTTLKGGSPETLELKVTDKIEEVVNTISGIKEMRSVSLENVSQIVIQFELEKNVDVAAQEVRDKIARVKSELPKEADEPVVEKLDIGAKPVISMVVASDMSIRDTTKYSKDVIKEYLQKLSGVGSIKIIGGLERQIRIWLHNEKMIRHDITVSEVTRALQTENIEIPGGSLETGPRDIVVKVKGEIEKIEDFKKLNVAIKNGYTVKLGDVATIEDGVEDQKNYARLNGKQAVAVQVSKQSGTNTVKVADDVKNALEKLKPQLPKGMEIKIVSDQSKYIKISIEEVFFHLIFGGGLAILIVFVFLRNVKTTLISALAIPTSVISTFAFMKYMNFTFNNLTMLALSLSIGMLIDDAIVVLENIYRHQAEEGKGMIEAALTGTSEIGLAVVATTFSIVAVFVPVAFMKGLIGRFFFEFGMTVTFAVLISLFISFTMTPMLCSRFMKVTKSHGFFYNLLEKIFDGIDAFYLFFLRISLRMRLVVIILSVLLLLGSLNMAKLIKSEFTPDEDKDQFSINIETPTGSSIEYTQNVMKDLEKELINNKKIITVYSTVAADAQEKANAGNIFVELIPKAQRPEESQMAVMTKYRQIFKNFEKGIVTIENVSDIGSSGGRNASLQYVLQGPNLEKLNEYAIQLIDKLKQVKGIVDIDTTYKTGKPEASVYIDRDRASQLYVPIASIASAVRTLVGGEKVSKFKEGGNQYDVNVRLALSERNAIDSINNFYVRSASGQAIDFKNLVKIEQSSGPTQINRLNRQRQITILANLDNLPMGEAINEINKLSASIKMPPEYSGKFTGMADIMKESFQSIFFALFLAILIVYMILASQFESFIHPFTIMLSLPLSVIGALGGLLIFKKTLSIFSLIGIIMLMGLVTKNAILLIDYIITLRHNGFNRFDAIIKAGPTRLRPILMTTAAMVFGMLPIAMSTGSGSESRSPMAICVIGGLITSTILTLIVIPVVYTLLDDMVSYFTGTNENTAPEKQA
ncbi:MAG: efflux RND transporter permease subunit [Candidatus Wallbacteria bacterium]